MILDGKKTYIGGIALGIAQVLKLIPDETCQRIAPVFEAIAAFLLPIGVAHKLSKTAK